MTGSMKVLETERLRLRPFGVEDAVFVLELVNEQGWLRHIGDRGVRTLADAEGYILKGPVAMYARMGFGLLAVERKADGVVIGMCGLIKRDTMEDVDLGYAVLERHWGQGYALEAARAALAYGYEVVKLPRIVALTALENERSIRLLEKMGFRFERLVGVRADGAESRLFVHTKPA
jgi:RimJ/RimL family protein N-acetyltransferase